MDPEFLLPLGLVIAGMVGVVSRRKKAAKGTEAGSSNPTVGQRADDAGAWLSRTAASAVRATGRIGLDAATKVAAGAGAATSAAAGLVIDGGVTSIRSAARPVVRGGARAVSGAARALSPGRSRARDAVDTPPADNTMPEEIMVVTSVRGKRFHLAECALVPADPIEMSRPRAVASSRRPCPTCHP